MAITRQSLAPKESSNVPGSGAEMARNIASMNVFGLALAKDDTAIPTITQITEAQAGKLKGSPLYADNDAALENYTRTVVDSLKVGERLVFLRENPEEGVPSFDTNATPETILTFLRACREGRNARKQGEAVVTGTIDLARAQLDGVKADGSENE